MKKKIVIKFSGKVFAMENVKLLKDYARFLVKTSKTYQPIIGKFIPVGEETYCAAIKKPEGYVVILVDGDGYTKTQSKDLEKEEASKIFAKVIESGIEEFPGNTISIWTEQFDTIQSELE